MPARSVPQVVLLLLSFHENSSRGTKYPASNFLEGLFWFKTAFHIKTHEIYTLDSSQGRNKCFTQPRLWCERGGEEPVSSQVPTDGDVQGEAGPVPLPALVLWQGLGRCSLSVTLMSCKPGCCCPSAFSPADGAVPASSGSQCPPSGDGTQVPGAQAEGHIQHPSWDTRAETEVFWLLRNTDFRAVHSAGHATSLREPCLCFSASLSPKRLCPCYFSSG